MEERRQIAEITLEDCSSKYDYADRGKEAKNGYTMVEFF
jgi:hypothetical protein